MQTFSLNQIIDQLRTQWGGSYEGSYYAWQYSTVTYSIADFYPTNQTYTESGAFTMTATMKSVARLGYELWDDVIAINLTESVNDPSANITTNWATTTNGGGTYTNFWWSGSTGKYYNSVAAQVWLNKTWTSLDQDSDFGYGYYGETILVHEIGHALGLSHPGTYDASSGNPTYATDAEFTQDNRQYTIMSYFGGYNPATNSWTQDGTYSTWYYPQTPMVYDIAAIQATYGADYTTRSGNSTYGFNVTADVAARGDSFGSVFNFAQNAHPIFTIWDGGGTDTLDCSGYSANQVISLLPGSYSSIGGMTNNIGIAFGCYIENAIGGSGNDTITGNEANNVIRGRGGNDVIDGGGGTDSAVFSGLRSAYTITALTGNSVRVSGPDGTDTLTNIELLVFDDQTWNWPLPIARFDSTVKFGDFNADGRKDFLYVTSAGLAFVSTSTASGTTAWAPWGSGATLNDQVADVNGDGRSDLIQYYNGSEYVSLSNGSTFGAWTKWVTGAAAADRVIDVNGDGRADLVEYYNGSEYIALSTGSSFGAWTKWAAGASSTDYLVDVTGDGRKDLIQFYNGNEYVAVNNGSSFGSFTKWISGATSADVTGDVNGDGRADLIEFYNGSEYVALSNGSSFGAWTKWISGAQANDRLANVNGTGGLDLVEYYNGSYYVALSNGSSFGAWTKWVTGATASDQLVDVNGDGKVDLLQFYNGSAYAALSNGSSFGAWTKWGSPSSGSAVDQSAGSNVSADTSGAKDAGTGTNLAFGSSAEIVLNDSSHFSFDKLSTGASSADWAAAAGPGEAGQLHVSVPIGAYVVDEPVAWAGAYGTCGAGLHLDYHLFV